MKITPAEIIRSLNALSVLRENASDKEASLAPGAYRTLKRDGSVIRVGTRVSVGGTLYRARVDLWDTRENSPESVPSLWERVLYRNGIRVIPDAITAESPFTLGEYGWWGDVLMRSVYIGANVWTPAEYPDAWETASDT